MKSFFIKKDIDNVLNEIVFLNSHFSNKHIDSIEKAKLKLSDDSRTMELKNWLNYLKN